MKNIFVLLAGSNDGKKKEFLQQKKYIQICNNKDKAITLTSRMFASWDGNYIDLSKYFIPPEKAHQICIEEVNRRKIGYIYQDTQGNRIYSIHGKSVTLSAISGGIGGKTGLYLFCCSKPERIKLSQNGQRFSPGIKFYTLTAMDRHGILADARIRKLHPIECERLQTLPDCYTEGVSDNQRYRALGNGWTVDVISHLLRSLNNA